MGSGFFCIGTIAIHLIFTPSTPPRRQLRLVLAWAQLHEDELMQNWELARDRQPLRSIQGLM